MTFLDYGDLVQHIVTNGSGAINARTKEEVVECFGLHFNVELNLGLVLPNLRRVFPYTAAAELAWSIMGTRRVSWLSTRAAIWDKFADANGNIETAYGWRWRNHFGRDQLMGVIQELTFDSSSRQAVLCAWDPSRDGLVGAGMGQRQSNVPCPLLCVFGIVEGGLHCHVMLRSSDVMVGLPYDIMMYALLTDAVARSLDIPPVKTVLSLANAHIYQRHFSTAVKMLELQQNAGTMPLPGWSVKQIESDPDRYLADVKEHAERTRRPDFSVKLEAVL